MASDRGDAFLLVFVDDSSLVDRETEEAMGGFDGDVVGGLMGRDSQQAKNLCVPLF